MTVKIARKPLTNKTLMPIVKIVMELPIDFYRSGTGSLLAVLAGIVMGQMTIKMALNQLKNKGLMPIVSIVMEFPIDFFRNGTGAGIGTGATKRKGTGYLPNPVPSTVTVFPESIMVYR